MKTLFNLAGGRLGTQADKSWIVGHFQQYNLNTRIETFPDLIPARLFAFRPAEYFEFEPADQGA